MAVLPAPTAPTHQVGSTAFTALASPSRGTTDTSVWQVEIAAGTPPTPHQVTREEIFVVLAGSGDVRLGDDRQPARAGDTIVVPPGVPFELTNTGDGPLRALVCLPVGGQAQVPGGEPVVPPWAE